MIGLEFQLIKNHFAACIYTLLIPYYATPYVDTVKTDIGTQVKKKKGRQVFLYTDRKGTLRLFVMADKNVYLHDTLWRW